LQIIQNSKALFVFIITVFLTVLLFTLPACSTSPSQGQQFHFIHLDGISYDLFQQELEAGMLLDIQAFFTNDRKLYQCQNCRHQASVTSGTIMQ